MTTAAGAREGRVTRGRDAIGGSGLVEVMVALVVLEIGLLGVVGLLVAASRTLARAAVLEHAVTVAGGLADSLQALPSVGSGEVGGGSLTVRWRPHAAGVLLEATTRAGSQPILELVLPSGPEPR